MKTLKKCAMGVGAVALSASSVLAQTSGGGGTAPDITADITGAIDTFGGYVSLVVVAALGFAAIKMARKWFFKVG